MNQFLPSIACLTIILNSSFLFAQAPSIEWQKSLGGTSTDQAYSIKQTSDGGYIVAGTAQSNDGDVIGNHGSYDAWLVKFDNLGDTVWQKSLGGSLTDGANSIIQTTDGGYIFAGYTSSTDGDVTFNNGIYDYWVVKLNTLGDTVWQKSLGGTGSDRAYSIQQTSDGGFVVAGKSSSDDGDVSGHHGPACSNCDDYWVVKLDAIGNIQWQKSLGGTGGDIANSIQQTTDGGYIIVGNSTSTDGNVTGHHGIDNFDYWVVKLSNVGGTIQWQKSFGGTNSDYAYSVQQVSDGGYVVSGYSASNDGDVTCGGGGWLLKLNSSGNILWQQCYSGTAYSTQQTSDGGYITAGAVNGDYWIAKLSNIGAIQWQTTLGGSNSEGANSIQQTIDGGYIISGYSKSNDGDVTGHHGDVAFYDYWVVKLGIGTVNIVVKDNEINLFISPNPATTQLTIKTDNITQTDYTIYDVTGRILSTGSFNQNTTISINDFAKGNYIIQLTNNQNTTIQKFIKQ